MADSNEKEKKQVMDVAKPGSTGADPSSRPIIVNHGGMMKDPMVTDAAPAAEAKAEPAAEPAQAAPEAAKPGIMPSHRVIQPLTSDKPAEEEKKPEEPAEEPEADISNGIEGSDEAVVDAVVGQAGGKKKEGELTEEEKKQQEALEKLVEDKTYFVPIGQVHRRQRRNALFVILLVLALVGGGLVYAYTSDIIKLDFIRSSKSNDSQKSINQTTVAPAPTVATVDPTPVLTTYTNKELGFSFEYPSTWRINAQHFDEDGDAGDRIVVISPKEKVVAVTQDQDGVHKNTIDGSAQVQIIVTKGQIGYFGGLIQVVDCKASTIDIAGTKGTDYLKAVNYQAGLYLIGVNEFVLAKTDCSKDKLPKVDTGFQLSSGKNYYNASLIYAPVSTDKQIQEMAILFGIPVDQKVVTAKDSYQQAIKILQSLKSTQ